MNKRIISLIMSILMSVTVTNIPVAAYEDIGDGSRLEEAISFFEDLGLVKGYEDGLFRPDQGMMRADFAILMANLLGYTDDMTFPTQHFEDVPESNAAYGSVEFLYDKGLVKGTESGLFEPDTPIMYIHALKMVTSALGYDFYAELNGGYPDGYYQAASHANLPANFDTTAVITSGQACILLFKAMSAPMMGYKIDGTYMQDKAKTLMNTTLYITKHEGMFVANEELSIFGEYSLEPGYVVLDYKTYPTDLRNLTDKVGHYVEYYLDEDENVIAIYDTAEETIKIDGADINPSSTKNVISYYDGRKDKDYNIATDAYFVYNGVPMPNITDDMFDDIYGSVVLVNNENDKYADTVIIWDYIDYVVNGYSDFSGKIYTSYPEREFDLEKLTYVLKKNGVVIEPSEIKANDILTVAENSKSVVINVSDTVINGMIEAEDGEGNIKISGKYYKKAPGMKDGFDYRVVYDFYLDALGNVFSFEKVGGERVGYIYKSWYGEDGEDLEGVYSRVFTEEGKKEIYKYAERVQVYHGNNKTSYESRDVLSKFLLDSEGKVIDQLAKYELNNNGEIGKIKIAVNVGWEEDWGEDYFKCNMDTAVAKANYDNKTGVEPSFKSEQANVYNNQLSWVNGDADDREYAVRMSAEGKVFIISSREKDWTVSSATAFPNGKAFKNAKIYDISEKAYVGYILVKDAQAVASSSYGYTDPMILVTKKMSMLNEDDEACYALIGMNSDGEEQTYYSKEEEVETDSFITPYPDAMLDDVQVGDVVQLKVDSLNNITGFRILCKAKGTPEYYFNAYPTDQGSANFQVAPVSHANLYHGPTGYASGMYIYKSSQQAIDDYDKGIQTKYPVRRYKFSIGGVALVFDKDRKTAEVIQSGAGFASDDAFIYEYTGFGRRMVVLYQ